MSDNQYDRADDVDRDVDRNPMERGKWVSAIIALAGLWLVVEALWFDILPANFWNDVVVGGLLIALGSYNFYRRTNEKLGSTAAAAVSALLGLWLVVSPWVYGDGAVNLATVGGFWNDIIVGLIVFALGAYSVYETRDTDVATTTT